MNGNNGNHPGDLDGPGRPDAQPFRVSTDRRAGKQVLDGERLEELRRLIRLMRRISPDGGRLTFKELLGVAKRNAEVYERFVGTRVPINALEARVGEPKFWNTVLNHPDGVTETTFERDLPQDAVLQVWRSADRQFGEVPLLFQPLAEVPAEGLSRTEHYGHGRSITLGVKRNESGEFKVRLSFTVGEQAVAAGRFGAAAKEVPSASPSGGAAGASSPAHSHGRVVPLPDRGVGFGRRELMKMAALIVVVLSSTLLGYHLVAQRAFLNVIMALRDEAEGRRRAAAPDERAPASPSGGTQVAEVRVPAATEVPPGGKSVAKPSRRSPRRSIVRGGLRQATGNARIVSNRRRPNPDGYHASYKRTIAGYSSSASRGGVRVIGRRGEEYSGGSRAGGAMRAASKPTGDFLLGEPAGHTSDSPEADRFPKRAQLLPQHGANFIGAGGTGRPPVAGINALKRRKKIEDGTAKIFVGGGRNRIARGQSRQAKARASARHRTRAGGRGTASAGKLLTNSDLKGPELAPVDIANGGRADGRHATLEAELRGVRRVYVEDLDAPSLDRGTKEFARNEVIKALKKDGSVEVLGRRGHLHTDGIIKLRLGRRELEDGIISVEMQVSDQSVWSNRDGCGIPGLKSLYRALCNASLQISEKIGPREVLAEAGEQ